MKSTSKVAKGKASAAEMSAPVKRTRSPLFWVLITLLLVTLFCIATGVALWFTGDTLVQMLRNSIQ